jgi:two-component system phosphate regulon sensor histidine kinase PhoR
VRALGAYVLLQFSWWAYLLATSGGPREQWMVLGEGSVFAFLLILGLHRIVRSMRRERERLARERNMLLGVTHELKTPLASVQLGVDTLRRMTLSESDRLTVLENMQSGLRDLERRVEDMLVATRLQKSTPVQATRFSWQGMAEEAVERCSTAGSSRVMLERGSEADFEVRGDQGLWTLAAANVVENALKYSDGPVRVRAFSEGSTAVLEVEDEGPGIAPKDWEAAKSPFVRLQEGGAGTGLGLHLVAQTAELHGGRIEMQRGKPSGFVVRLVWPSVN